MAGRRAPGWGRSQCRCRQRQAAKVGAQVAARLRLSKAARWWHTGRHSCPPGYTGCKHVDCWGDEGGVGGKASHYTCPCGAVEQWACTGECKLCSNAECGSTYSGAVPHHTTKVQSGKEEPKGLLVVQAWIPQPTCVVACHTTCSGGQEEPRASLRVPTAYSLQHPLGHGTGKAGPAARHEVRISSAARCAPA